MGVLNHRLLSLLVKKSRTWSSDLSRTVLQRIDDVRQSSESTLLGLLTSEEPVEVVRQGDPSEDRRETTGKFTRETVPSETHLSEECTIECQGLSHETVCSFFDVPQKTGSKLQGLTVKTVKDNQFI